ncbi:hypothetical protein J6590_090042 [Homalodisca vitripennis]|nr:hypothetical protein J6590_090042 [Homalodisca vitripennis]
MAPGRSGGSHRRMGLCSQKAMKLGKDSVAFRDWYKEHKPNCEKNFDGSSPAMEPEAAARILKRSEKMASDAESDDVSIESSDESYISGDDPDIGTAPPVWALTTSGLRPITFVRLSELLVPCPGEGTPIDYFRLLLDDILLENIIKLSNTYAFEVFGDEDVVEDSHHFSESEQSADEKQPNEEAENSGPADEEEARPARQLVSLGLSAHTVEAVLPSIKDSRKVLTWNSTRGANPPRQNPPSAGFALSPTEYCLRWTSALSHPFTLVLVLVDLVYLSLTEWTSLANFILLTSHRSVTRQ